MKTSPIKLNRREFGKRAVLAGAALMTVQTGGLAAESAPTRIRVGVIGCGSVSHQYLPQLTKSRSVEVVSLCDIRYERAQKQGENFNVRNTYPNIEAMLAGEQFEFLVDLTDMQQHEGINQRALQAGKHVW